MRSLRIALRLTVALSAFAALAVAAPALAATKLPTPATPVASGVTTTSVTLSWSAPAGPVAGYTIQKITGRDPWGVLATTTATTFTHTGLTPDTVYIYRVIANPVPGSDHTASDPSGHLYVTTEPLPDSIPPTTPGTPLPTQPSTIWATIHFAASTDNHRVAGYWVQRQVNGVWTDWETNSVSTVYLRNLTPGTSYTVVVVAFDANRNRSPRSAPFTFTTRQLEPEPTCRTTVTNYGQQALLSVTVENMTATTVLQNWTVRFNVPLSNVVNSSFNATISRDGERATATPAVWYTTVNPGGIATFGVFLAFPAGSPLPSGFALHNGSHSYPCA